MAEDTAADRLRALKSVHPREGEPGGEIMTWEAPAARQQAVFAVWHAGDALLALVEAAEFVLRRAVTDGVVRSHTADVLGVPNLRTCLTALRDALPPVPGETP